MTVTPARLIETIAYKPGWSFKIGGPGHRFVCVFARTVDSTAPSRERITQHMFELPDATGPDLVRWLFDRLLDIERHEAAEFFRLDGDAPFWPYHQDEGSPYELVERMTPWPSSLPLPASAGS